MPARTLERRRHRPPDAVTPRPPGVRLLETCLVVEGGSFTLLVASDGSPLWRMVRALVAIGITTGAYLALRPGRSRAGAATATAVGLVGTIAGAAIGVLHVIKGDVSFSAVAALLALAGSVPLLVAGTARSIRSTHGARRLLAVPVAFAVLQFVAVPVATAVYGTNAPRPMLDAATPADRGFTYADVAFSTTDGVRLSGWYIPSRNGGAVALLHGAGETRSAVLEHATVLARHGYGVLLFDARGHGRSGGDANEFGWYGDRDVAAAITYLATRADVRDGRIGAVGESMGGEEALGAAAHDTRIRAVVAEGALWRVPADAAWLSHDPQGLISRTDLWIQAALTDVLSGAPRPIGLRDAVRATAPRPVLLIAGKDEIAGDRGYRAASPTNVQLWELPDTPHTKGLARHPAEWEQRVVSFLDGALTR